MNIQLAGTEEFIDGKSKGSLGQVLIRCVYLCGLRGFRREIGKRRLAYWRKEGKFWIGREKQADFSPPQSGRRGVSRCNNVLWISAATKSEGDRGDVKMEG